MRNLIVSALLLATASCEWVPPPAAAPLAPGTAVAPAPVPLVPMAASAPAPAATPAAPVPPPMPAAAPPAAQAVAPAPGMMWPPPEYVGAPLPLAWVFGPPSGRLTLSNFSYPGAHVQTVVTSFADCDAHQGTQASDFTLPLNGTRVVVALPGSDVCWRRAIEAGSDETPTPPNWTEWSRVYTSTGRMIDSRL